MEDKKKFTLKALRVNNNWTRDEASKLYGVSVDTIKNYETYKTFPDIPTLERILKVTGMSYDDIIFLPKDYGLTEKNKQY